MQARCRLGAGRWISRQRERRLGHRARAAEWHDEYTLPSLMDFYEPSRASHGSYWFDWTTEDEIAWKNFYRVWMQLINDYKKMGGRVTTAKCALASTSAGRCQEPSNAKASQPITKTGGSGPPRVRRLRMGSIV